METQTVGTSNVGTALQAGTTKRKGRQPGQTVVIRPIDDADFTNELVKAVQTPGMTLSKFAKDYATAKNLNEKSLTQKYYSWKKKYDLMLNDKDESPENKGFAKTILEGMTFKNSGSGKRAPKQNLQTLASIFATLGDKPKTETLPVVEAKQSETVINTQGNEDIVIQVGDKQPIRIHQTSASNQNVKAAASV